MKIQELQSCGTDHPTTRPSEQSIITDPPLCVLTLCNTEQIEMFAESGPGW